MTLHYRAQSFLVIDASCGGGTALTLPDNCATRGIWGSQAASKPVCTDCVAQMEECVAMVSMQAMKGSSHSLQALDST